MRGWGVVVRLQVRGKGSWLGNIRVSYTDFWGLALDFLAIGFENIFGLVYYIFWLSGIIEEILLSTRDV